jgi:starch synthase
VHNFAYQGNFDFRYAPAKEKDNGVKPLASIFSPDFQRQNPVLRGIRMADAISTVSPTHAIEVLTPQFGEGLDEELVKARGKLTGILNGLDTKEFNPATDPIITKNYSERSFINARLINKKALQKLFSLPLDEKAPLFISCGRLSMQKGWDILLQVLPHLFVFRKDAQLIVLGSGDQGNYREKLKALQEEFPGQVGLHLRGDFRLPRKLYAGGDMILIPSLFEPGGIVALEALRYGCIPIVSRTGGLNDIIIDYSPRTMEGNGFSFSNQDPWALFGTISRALAYFDDARLWHQLVKNALMCDFSWEHSAKEYDHWYEQVVEVRKRAISETPHPAYEASV